MSAPETLTLLLTDLVDSTELARALGDAEAAQLSARHDRVARDLLAAHGGREIDKSDGFLHIFSDAEAAVAYALAYHAALRALSAELGRPLRARAGLHTGEVMLIENRADDVARGAKPVEVEGIAKATAARVMTLAIGGQTLLTAATAAACPPGLHLVSHGHYRMKGLPEPMELLEAVAADGAPARPPPDSPKVHRVVQTDGGWRPAREVPHNLGPERASFFGRAGELRAVAEAFGDGAPVVSLVGPGGSGKTETALQYARSWLGDWPGGAWFCELSECRDEAEALGALGRALGVPLEQGDPVGTLAEALCHRGRTLVLLDNVEQIIDVTAALVSTLSGRAPAVGWLVTSRQRLDLRGERVVPNDPLPVPEPLAPLSVLSLSPAVALFTARAQAVLPSFRLDASTAPDVARLVGLLDGLPLAIELAAARVRVLPPRRILERMSRRFELLRDQRARGAARQSTLKGALDWSWDLLSPPERAAFAQCAVFEGGFSLEAAEVVLELGPWPDAPPAVDLIESLVDKSLVRAVAAADGERRFSLFRSFTDYAAEKLDDPEAVADPDGAPATGPEARADAEARHALHFSRWGQPASLRALRGPDQRAQRRELQAELDNVVAAARRAAARGEGATAAEAALGALALLSATGPLSLAQTVAEAALEGLAAEGGAKGGELALRVRAQLGAVLARAGRGDEAEELLAAVSDDAKAQRKPALAAQAGVARGAALLQRGQHEAAEALLREALQLAEQARDKQAQADALTELAHAIGIRGGRFAEAEAALQRALREQRAAGDLSGEALTRSYQGALAGIQGDFPAALGAYQRARDLARELGDRRTEGLCEGMLGNISALTGEADAADAAFRRAVDLASSIGDLAHEALHIGNYAQLLQRQGEAEAAAGWLRRAIDIAERTGDPVAEGHALATLGALEADAGDLRAARATLTRGLARLSEAGDPVERAKVLCRLGQVELARSDAAAAAANLAAARALADGLQLGEDAELVKQIDALAAALAG
jgi:predicted ATPase/class 3 adenylate cyclase/Tfp pilus assembly protein PilF